MEHVDIKEFDPNKMDLNEVIYVENYKNPLGLQVMKVPSGWVYVHYSLGRGLSSSVFVPELGVGISEGAK